MIEAGRDSTGVPNLHDSFADIEISAFSLLPSIVVPDPDSVIHENNTINLTVAGTYKITLAASGQENNTGGDFDILGKASGGNLKYGGGSIQSKPIIYVVYWQFGTYGDPSGEQAMLHSLYSGIGGSSWLNTVTQYYGPVGTFISNSSGQLAGEWVDNTDKLPKHLGTSAIASEALVAVKHFGYDFNAAYVVATPHGHNTSGFGTQYCAYHTHGTTTSGTVYYAAMPHDQDYVSGCTSSYASPNTDVAANSEVNTLAHETEETTTDPLGNAWYDNRGYENADKCAWTWGTTATANGGVYNLKLNSSNYFLVQQNWVNAGSGGCATG